MERTSKITKLRDGSAYEPYDHDEVRIANFGPLESSIGSPAQMIIDTEWGGFGDRGEADYILTPYDKIVDARSVHPGVQMYAC